MIAPQTLSEAIKFNFFFLRRTGREWLSQALHAFTALTVGSAENCFYKPALWVLCSFFNLTPQTQSERCKEREDCKVVPYNARIKCHKDDDIGFEGMDFTEVCNVCASCTVLEKQWLSVEDSDCMVMLIGNNFYTYTESRLSYESCTRSTTYRVFHNTLSLVDTKEHPYMEHR